MTDSNPVETSRANLIGKLKAAPHGSRKLDCDIAVFLGRVPDGAVWHKARDCWWTPRGAQFAPEWTTSIDVALSLMPDGRMWDIDSLGYATIFGSETKTPILGRGNGATPALGVCIAAIGII